MLTTAIKRRIVAHNKLSIVNNNTLKTVASIPTATSLINNTSSFFSSSSAQNSDVHSSSSAKPSFFKHLLRPGSQPPQYDPSFGDIYQFKGLKDLEGHKFDFSKLKGKVILITNVACDCGYTKSGYNHLVDWKNQFRDAPFEVVAFPSNSFNQEKRSPAEIKEFVSQFHVNFPMLEKSDVNGPNQNPVYAFLKKSFKGEEDITWNFSSYFLIDHHGIPIARYEKESWKDITAGIASAVQAADKNAKQ